MTGLAMLAIAVLIASIGGVAAMVHLGWTARLDTLFERGELTLAWITRRMTRFYLKQILPAIRGTKVYTCVVIAASAIGAYFTDLTIAPCLVLSLIAAILCAVVMRVERQGTHLEQRAVIPAGTTELVINYPAGVVIDRRPINELEPLDDLQDFDYETVDFRPRGFTIRLLAPATSDIHFWWRAAQRPQGMPGTRILTVAVEALATMGFTIRIAGVLCHSRQAVMLSILAVSAAVALFFTMTRFYAWLAEKVASLVEIAPNMIFQLAALAARGKFDDIDAMMQRVTNSDKQLISVFKQEDFEKLWRYNLTKVVAALAVGYGIDLLIPDPSAAFIWTLTTVITWLCVHLYVYRIDQLGRDLDKASKEQTEAETSRSPSRIAAAEAQIKGIVDARNVLVERFRNFKLVGIPAFIGLMLTLLVLVIYIMVVPGAESDVNQLIADGKQMMHGLFYGTSQGFGWAAKKSVGTYVPALFAAVMFLAFTAAVWGTGESRIRKALAGLPAIIALAAFLTFMYGASVAFARTAVDQTVGVGGVFGVDGLTSKVKISKVGGMSTPLVEISWEGSVDEKGFTVERMGAGDTGYYPASRPLASGVRVWQDGVNNADCPAVRPDISIISCPAGSKVPAPTEGQTFQYRLVIRDGGDVPTYTEPITVEAVTRNAPPAGTGSAKPKPPVACTAASCGQNTGLKALCDQGLVSGKRCAALFPHKP